MGSHFGLRENPSRNKGRLLKAKNEYAPAHATTPLGCGDLRRVVIWL
jgi:hypothetical protein